MKKIYLLVLFISLSITSNAQVVISQVYGGGGNTGATYKNDFVELFNKGNASVDVSNWSVQYASATGTSWAVNVIPASTTIAPGKYLLVQLGGGANGLDLPTADVTGTSNLSGTNGKVALVNNSTALSGANVTTGYEDLVGYGTGSSFETAAISTSGIDNTKSIQRSNQGCNDTNNNSADFSLGTVTPRNSSSPAYSCTAISLSISSPASGTEYAPTTTSVDVILSISNFNVATSGGDGHIHYTVNSGSTVMKYDTDPITLTVSAGNTYTVYVELVDNSHNPISPAVNTTVTFTVASLTTVADIAAMRADVIANGAGKYYAISSTPTITYARSIRNQKYIEDASGAVVIDDVAGTITAGVQGDGLASLVGYSFDFNGLLEFVPIQNATVATGATITPQVVTIADVLANPEMYESELLQITGVTLDNTTTTTFANNTNVAITAPTATTFRPIFSEADYIGQTIPATADLVCYAGQNTSAVTSTNNVYLVSRTLADIVLATKSFNAIDGLTMYPNPVSGNVLNITSANNSAMSVQIFDILGKQVANTTVVNNQVNVSNLTSGVYIVKITEDGKTATRKLVVK